MFIIHEYMAVSCCPQLWGFKTSTVHGSDFQSGRKITEKNISHQKSRKTFCLNTAFL